MRGRRKEAKGGGAHLSPDVGEGGLDEAREKSHKLSQGLGLKALVVRVEGGWIRPVASKKGSRRRDQLHPLHQNGQDLLTGSRCSPWTS